MKGIFPIDKFRTLQTPFYYYDTKVLRDTLSAINHEVAKYPNYSVHYAVKANANPKVLTIIRESGMGADCVSGGEIRAAIRAGFPANKVVFAGVGKADWEINLGLEYGIFCQMRIRGNADGQQHHIRMQWLTFFQQCQHGISVLSESGDSFTQP